MAHTVQAKKRIRQLKKHTDINRRRISRVRTFLRNVERAIESRDQNAAKEAFRAFQPEIMRGVSKGVFGKNTVARKLSRLNKRIKAIT